MDFYSKIINDKSCMERLMEKYPWIDHFIDIDIGQYFIFVRYNFIWKGRMTKFNTIYKIIWYEDNGKTGITVYGDEIKVFRMKDIQRNNLSNMITKIPIIPELKLVITDYLI